MQSLGRVKGLPDFLNSQNSKEDIVFALDIPMHPGISVVLCSTLAVSVLKFSYSVELFVLLLPFSN